MAREDIKNKVLGRSKNIVEKYESTAPVAKPQPDQPMMTKAPAPMHPLPTQMPQNVGPQITPQIVQQVPQFSQQSQQQVASKVNNFDATIKAHYMTTTQKAVDDKGWVQVKNNLATKGLLGFNDSDIPLAKYLIDSNIQRGNDPMFKVETKKVAGIELPIGVELATKPEVRENLAREGYKESRLQDTIDASRDKLQTAIISPTILGLGEMAKEKVKDMEKMGTIGYILGPLAPAVSALIPDNKQTEQIVKNLDIAKFRQNAPKAIEKINEFMSQEIALMDRDRSQKRSEAPEGFNAPFHSLSDDRLKDPKFLGMYMISEMAYMIPVMASAFVAGPAGMIGTLYPGAYYSLKQDLLKNGANEQQAEMLGKAGGTLIAGVEGLFNMLQLNKIPVLRKFLGSEVRPLITKSLLDIIKGGAKAAAGMTMEERGEELAQEVLQNGLVKIFNKDKKLIDNRKDLLIRTFIGITPLSTLAGVETIRYDAKNYTVEQRDKDRAAMIKYLMDRQPGLSIKIVTDDGFLNIPETKEQYQKSLDMIRKGEVISLADKTKTEDKISQEIEKENRTEIGQENTIQEDVDELVRVQRALGLEDHEYDAGAIAKSVAKLPPLTKDKDIQKRKELLEAAQYYAQRIQDKETHPESYGDVDVNKLMDKALKNPDLGAWAEKTPKAKRELIVQEIDAFYNDGIMPNNPEAKRLVDEYEEKGKVRPNNKITTEVIKDIKDTALATFDMPEQDMTPPWEKEEQIPEVVTPTKEKEITIKGKYEDRIVKVPIKEEPKKQPTKKTPEDPQLQKQVAEIMEKLVKGKATEFIKKRITGKFQSEKKTIDKIAEAMAYQPTVADYQKMYSDPAILEQAKEMMYQRGMVDREVDRVFTKMLNTISEKANEKNKMVSREGYLTEKMKMVFNQWDSYKIPIKGKLEDIKVKFLPLKEFLSKNLDNKLHLVELPKLPIGQISKPFAMMGTKEKTFWKLMASDISQAVQQGQEVYNEPFSGVGTTLRYLPNIFNNGLKKANLNFFDIEKYTIVKAMKDGKLERKEIRTEVKEAYDTIIGQITKEIIKDPDIAQIFEEAKNAEVRDEVGMLFEGMYMKDNVKVKAKGEDVELGTKLFQQAMEVVGFYPTLAKEFFQQTIDSKLAVKGDITETFKNRLRDKIEKTIKKETTDLTPEELKMAIEEKLTEILDNPQIFEGKYAEISKKIKDIIDAYDNDGYVAGIKGDVKKAMLVTIARHFRQRGTSGQKVISPSDGFSNLQNITLKVAEGLRLYATTLKNYGDRINLENMDGKEFIAKHSQGDQSKQIRYLDPPYVRTTKTYIGNNPELNNALQDYANANQFGNIIDPIKDAGTMILTNDIDGDYFQAVKDTLGQRMGENILGYKEGLTPTSYITTQNINKNVNQRAMLYFQLNKNKKIQDAISFRTQELESIGKGLKKNLAKFLTYVSKEVAETSKMMSKIREGIEKGQMRFEELTYAIDNMTSGRQKVEILNEAKKLARKGNITGDGLIKMVNIINQYMDARKSLLGRAKRLQTDIKSLGIDVQTRKYLQEQLNEFSFKRPAEDTTRESIYSMSNEELSDFIDRIRQEIKGGRESLRAKIDARNEDIQAEVEKYSQQVIKYEFPEKEQYEIGMQEKGIKGAIRSSLNKKKEALYKTRDDIEVRETQARSMNLEKLNYDYIQDPFYGWKADMSNIEHLRNEKVAELEKKYGAYTKLEMNEISMYGLAMRSDGKGIPGLMAYFESLRYSEQKVNDTIDRIRLGENMNDKKLELYRWMQEQYNIMGEKLRLAVERSENMIFTKVDNYRPIQINRKAMDNVPESIQNNLSVREAMKENYARKGIQKGFTKEAKGGKVVPMLDAMRSFNKHMDDAYYYINMQEPLSRLTKIVDLMKESMGRRGYRMWTEQIDNLKTKGPNVNIGVAGRGVEKMINNTTKAYLGYRVFTSVLGLTDIGFAEAWTGRGTIANSMVDVAMNKVTRDVVKKYSQELRYRVPKDPLIIDRLNLESMTKESKILSSLKKKLKVDLKEAATKTAKVGDMIDQHSMDMIKYMDYYVGSAIFINEFNYRLKQEGVDKDTATPEQLKEAAQYADSLVRKVIGDPTFKGMGRFIQTHRGIFKIITVYQNFANVRLSTLVATTRRARATRNYSQLLRVLVVMALVTGIEEARRRGYRISRGKKNRQSIVKEFFTTAFGSIPYIGPTVKFVAGQDSILKDTVGGIISSKNYQSTDLFISKVMVSLLMLAGLTPGYLQIKEIVDVLSDDKPSSSKTVKKIQLPSSSATRRRLDRRSTTRKPASR